MADSQLEPDIQTFYSKKRLPPILGGKAFKQRSSDRAENLHDEASREEVRQLRGRPDIESIVEAVSAVFGVAEEEIYRVKRGRGNKNTPRKVAMYLAQNEGGYRLTDIAAAFGLNHYGGVSFAIQSFAQELQVNKSLARILKIIINRFNS